MATIDTKILKELRERTGVGMAKCKEALVQTHGNLNQAIEFLRKAGIASAVKKEARATNEGKVEYIDTSGRIVLVEANAETDFVVKNERFIEFHQNVCQEALAEEDHTLESLLQQKYSKNPQQTVDEYRKEVVSVLGENVSISRVLSMKKKREASYGIYSHMGGKIVVVVEIEGSSDEEELAKEIALHIAAEAPDYLVPSDIPPDILEKEREIAASQIKGKSPDVTGKIVEGKLRAFYEKVCLLSQKYVKDSALTVAEVVENRGKAASKHLKISHFVRWQVGR